VLGLSTEEGDGVFENGCDDGELSLTALGEPGRLTIKVPERMPQTPREIMAIGVV